ncbi:MAG TPA: GNAT family N-acetyltransferase [Thermoleophilaceae bacterium]|nr:GNAT family N-acetyltransferase [Thermoleophilaceae bacterium]
MEDARAAVIDPIEDPRWMGLMECPDASIFHHPAWLRILRDSYRYDIWACCLFDEGGVPVAGLPVATIRSRLTGDRLVSLPFSDVCAPVVGDDDRHLAQLGRALEQERGRLDLPLEIHGSLPGLPSATPGDEFVHHKVDLADGMERVSSRMHASKRRGVKKARREGVEVQRRTDRQALDAFYALHVRTRRKHGVPTQPKRFFRRLEELFRRELGFVLLAWHGGAPVAAEVLLVFNGVLTSKYSASDPQKGNLRANELVKFEAYRAACELGCRVVDLGRAEKDNHGLRGFKEDMGGEPQPLTYTLVPDRRAGGSVREVPALQRRLIRRAPPVFGRMLGAAVYRHFG